MASTYLSNTFGSAGNRKTFTISFWMKKASNSQTSTLFGAGTDLLYLNSDKLQFETASGTLKTSRVFRDVSAFYHCVIALDTTQATASDRMKFYVNGVQESIFDTSTYPSQNADASNFNTAVAHFIGKRPTLNDMYFDGLMTHFHFIDGIAYDASTFGETDATTGIWKPKTAPSVTYGSQGYFLKFENSGSMGTDSSGNGNNFTVNGTLTQTVDTPSNVFATFNPLNVPTSNAPTYSNGNNTVVTANGTSAYFGGTSSLGVSSGKWYTEFKVSDVTADAFIGITFDPAEDARNNRYTGQSSSSWGYYSGDGNYRTNGSATSYGATFTTGDIIGIAMDLDNAKLYFSKNGTFQNSGDPTSGATGTGAISITSGETYFFSCGDGTASSASTIQANFGNGYFGTTAVSSATSDESGLGIFEYSVPSGYYCLCTKNINLLEYA